MRTRTLRTLVPALPTSDGAGVKLRRSLGARQNLRLDPFLMLDEFSSEEASDYVAGFPPHPHRGFETVTYMIDGHMRHEDHLGNRGELRSGGVQWMTAGRGIVHSEMPQQQSGRMRGFQLWINLPAKEKMKPAGYRDIPAAEIPVLPLPGGGTVKVIAGAVEQGGARAQGPINGPAHPVSTEPFYLDVTLPAGARIVQPLPATHEAFLYVYEGAITLGEADGGTPVPAHHAAILGEGDAVAFRASDDARVLVLAGRPLREPVVQYGPFVMNTREEIEQAIADYQSGAFTRPSAAA